jgi:hypothetical protein
MSSVSYEELKDTTFQELMVCPLCGKTSLFWNWFTRVFECFNPQCPSTINRADTCSQNQAAKVCQAATAELPKSPPVAASIVKQTVVKQKPPKANLPAKTRVKPIQLPQIREGLKAKSKWATLLTSAVVIIGAGIIAYGLLNNGALGSAGIVIVALATILTTWNLVTLTFALKDRQQVRFSESIIPAAAVILVAIATAVLSVL